MSEITIKIYSIGNKDNQMLFSRKASTRFLQISGLFTDYFNNMHMQQPSNSEYTIYADCITEWAMDTMLTYLKLHDYEPKQEEQRVNGYHLDQNLCSINYNYIKDFPVFEKDPTGKFDSRLKDLIAVAEYFQIESLRLVCLKAIACYFYVGNEVNGFEIMKKRVGVSCEPNIHTQNDIIKFYTQIFQLNHNESPLQLQQKQQNEYDHQSQNYDQQVQKL